MTNRFTMGDREGFREGTRIITDSQTGVQYLFANWANAAALTVLVDKDGKPLIADEGLQEE